MHYIQLNHAKAYFCTLNLNLVLHCSVMWLSISTYLRSISHFSLIVLWVDMKSRSWRRIHHVSNLRTKEKVGCIIGMWYSKWNNEHLFGSWMHLTCEFNVSPSLIMLCLILKLFVKKHKTNWCCSRNSKLKFRISCLSLSPDPNQV